LYIRAVYRNGTVFSEITPQSVSNSRRNTNDQPSKNNNSWSDINRSRIQSWSRLLQHSSMYLLMLYFACCLRYDRSLLTVPLDTCNTCAISLWLCPWLLSSWTLFLRQSNSTAFFFLFLFMFNLQAQMFNFTVLLLKWVQLLRLKDNASP
jgi:hypothetical protein